MMYEYACHEANYGMNEPAEGRAVPREGRHEVGRQVRQVGQVRRAGRAWQAGAPAATPEPRMSGSEARCQASVRARGWARRQ